MRSLSPSASRALAQTSEANGARNPSRACPILLLRGIAGASERARTSDPLALGSDLRSLAISEAFRRWCVSLQRAAHRITRNRAEAADVVQDTFLRAVEQMPAFDNLEEIFGWLSVVVRRRAIDHVRRQKARGPRETHIELLSSPIAEDPQQWRRTMHVDVADILSSASLPSELLTVCLLRYDRRLSYAEISRRLGIPTATVGTRLHRAVRELRKFLSVAGRTARSASLSKPANKSVYERIPSDGAARNSQRARRLSLMQEADND